MSFSSLMDIDKLILELHGYDNVIRFSSLMDIDKLIRNACDFDTVKVLVL